MNNFQKTLTVLLSESSEETVRFGKIRRGDSFMYKGKQWVRTQGCTARRESGNGLNSADGSHSLVSIPFDVDTMVGKIESK